MVTNPLKILLIEDNPDDVSLIWIMMQSSEKSKKWKIENAENIKEALLKIEEDLFDIILLDLNLPDSDGLNSIKVLREKNADIPIVIITGQSSELLDSEVIKSGAQDLLLKQNLNRDLLIHIVLNSIETKRFQDVLLKRTLQLIESEKIALIGTMVAEIAHDLNTPLGLGVTSASYIKDNGRLFQTKFNDNKITKSDFSNFINNTISLSDSMLKNLRYSADLVKSFQRTISDQISDKKSLFNVQIMISDVIRSLSPKTRKTLLNIEIEGNNDLEISSYPGKLSRVITNLIINSMIHGYSNRTDLEGLIKMNYYISNNSFFLIYKDDGQGIAQDIIEKIFNPYFTTKEDDGGTGLGLHIVKSIIEKDLSGKIQCQSTLNQKTVFEISIPLSSSIK